jgi:hypothetical protein
MRKTLTAIIVVLAAGSLAACKMPWDKAETPPPATVATGPETTPAIPPETPDPTQTASTAPAQTAKPEPAPATPAQK